MIKILFVCLGNICRSPMAEAVFAHRLATEGLSGDVFVDSAGTGDWHAGAEPHFGTQQILTQHGVGYSHRARVLQGSDYDEFDLILAMDEDNYRTVLQRGNGRAQVRKLLEFAPECGYDDVPDPYYSGNFALTYELVSNAADGLILWAKKMLSLYQQSGDDE